MYITLAFLEHSVGIAQSVAFPDGLPSLSDMHGSSRMPFHGSDVHSFSGLSSTPLSRLAAVHPPAHLLRGVLVPSKYWQL